MRKNLVAAACALAIGVTGTLRSFAGQDDPTEDLAPPPLDPAAVVVDTVVVRPLCLAATVLGSAFFVVSLPVAATSKSIHRSAHALVVRPARATFTRPLGDFDDLKEGYR